MGRIAAAVGSLLLALFILAFITVAALIGLNAECNGTASECPRSTAYRVTHLSAPIVALLILGGGAVVSARRRSPVPLLMACGGTIALIFVVGSLS